MLIINKLRTSTSVIIASVIFFISCKTNQNTSDHKDEALALMEQTCYTCHSPNASQQNRLAPPMIGVKKHYDDGKITEEQFVADLVGFVMNPSEEKSKMPGAKNRFNLMPKIEYSQENVEKIARYIYRNDIESPEWFEKHYKEEMQENMEKSNLIDTTLITKGKKIAQVSQQKSRQKPDVGNSKRWTRICYGFL